MLKLEMERDHLPEKLFSKTCRTCMCKEEQSSQVFQSIFESPNQNPSARIVDLLNSAIPQLKFHTADELPEEICAQCINKVLRVCQFQQMCIHSETHMRSMLDYNRVEEKFSNTSEVSPTFETSAEDPLQSEVADRMVLIDFDEEIKKRLKMELQGEEDNRANFAFEDSANCQINNSKNDAKSENKEYNINEVNAVAATECDNADYKKDQSVNTETDRQETPNSKSQVKGLQTKRGNKLKNREIQQMENILEQPNVKNKRSASLPCGECGKIFDRSYSLNRHMNVHKAIGKPYECSNCKYRFTTKAHLKRHEIIHDSEMAKVFTLPGTTNNPEGYKCSDCPRRFAKRESLSAHRQSHRKTTNATEDSLNIYACPLCPKQFKKLNMLTRHSRNHEENKHFKCHLCDKAFGLNAHLIDHINKHNGVKPYVCNFCNKAFQQSCTLKDHIRTHTGEQPFLCSECGKAFNSSSNMKQHLLRHTGEKRYECPECPKKFPCLSDLASHMAVHKKVKPHVCDICGAAFGKPYQLKKHKMYHNGEKPHKCEYCEMRFVCADHMRRHMRTHTGEKPYKCKYCERAFAQSNDLVKHLRSHIGENVYKCELCPKAFRLATELREHFSQHKNDDEEKHAENSLALLDEVEQIGVSELADGTSIKGCNN